MSEKTLMQELEDEIKRQEADPYFSRIYAADLSEILNRHKSSIIVELTREEALGARIAAEHYGAKKLEEKFRAALDGMDEIKALEKDVNS